MSYSLLDAADVSILTAPGAMPQQAGRTRVMQVIHSAADTPDALDPAAIDRGIDVLEAALRAWDLHAAATD